MTKKKKEQSCNSTLAPVSILIFLHTSALYKLYTRDNVTLCSSPAHNSRTAPDDVVSTAGDGGVYIKSSSSSAVPVYSRAVRGIRQKLDRGVAAAGVVVYSVWPPRVFAATHRNCFYNDITRAIRD